MKAMVWRVVAVLAVSGCAGSAKWSAFAGSGTSSGGHSGQAQGPSQTVTMPNLVLLTRAEAEAKLRELGFTQPASLDTSACGSTLDDHKTVVELGRVCYQMPAAGRPASTGVPVSLRVQDENPWRGEYRAGRGWFLMPDFVGVHVDVARAKVRELGFTKEVKIGFVTEPGCQPNLVCRTSPEAWSRADTTSDKIFFVGQPPEPPRATADAAHSSEPAAQPRDGEAPPSSTKPADIF
ncbi:MAG: PASTA domain-containing protein [Kofleriaceae bacterium]